MRDPRPTLAECVDHWTEKRAGWFTDNIPVGVLFAVGGPATSAVDGGVTGLVSPHMRGFRNAVRDGAVQGAIGSSLEVAAKGLRGFNAPSRGALAMSIGREIARGAVSGAVSSGAGHVIGAAANTIGSAIRSAVSSWKSR